MDRGWGLFINKNEALRFLSELKLSLKEDPTGITYLVGSDPIVRKSDEFVRLFAEVVDSSDPVDSVALTKVLNKWQGPLLGD